MTSPPLDKRGRNEEKKKKKKKKKKRGKQRAARLDDALRPRRANGTS